MEKREAANHLKGVLGAEGAASVEVEEDENVEDENAPIVNRQEERAGPDEPIFTSKLQPSLAEFVGSTLFLLAGTMVIQADSLEAAALGHGFALGAMVTAFGRISGGHFNPAVTLGQLVAGGIGPLLAAMYVGAQLAGGLLAALIARGCLDYVPVGDPGHNVTVYESIVGGATLVSSGVSEGSAVLTELVFTFTLVLVVLLAALDTDSSSTFAPLPIGFTLAASILAAGPTTGASLNPARSFGPAVVASDVTTDVWRLHWVYWLGPLAGGLLAGGVYRMFFAAPDRRVLFNGK